MTAAFWQTVALLLGSNLFMTFAWYGHLNYRNRPLVVVILASWGLAFFEYCLQVPANRLGSGILTAPQLKVLQEAITLTLFGFFSLFYLGQRPTVHDGLAFVLVMAAVAVSLFQPTAHMH